MQRLYVLIIALTAMFSGSTRLLLGQGESKLDATVVQRALDDFQAALDQRWSYRHANGADFDAAITVLRKRAAAGMSVDELGFEVHRILALGVDGHAGVDGYQLRGSRYLPFRLEPDRDRFVAFNAERTAFLADGFPYLTRLDDRDVNDWCRAGAVLVPKGSPQYVRHRCFPRTRSIDFIRDQLALPHKDSVDVTVSSKDGARHRTLTLSLARTPPASSVWPPAGSRVLDGNIGYLRLTNMVRDPSVREIKQWMPTFRGTTGLIIDVRDNNGGDRDALLMLYSYLAARGDPPRVFNAAAYRLHPLHRNDHLAPNHRMYRADAVEWTDTQRRAVAEFAKRFTPRWQLPKGQFSAWHYMALVPNADADVYHYDKPIVVLMNGRSFSATDSFLAGLKTMKQVTLMGTPSSGGSAYTQEVMLGETPLRMRIGSIASFQEDGRLFDGHGVSPDVEVEATPEYYIGGPDNVLTEAMRRLATAR